MRINLEFADIAELQSFADWASARGTHTTFDVKLTEADLAGLARRFDTRPVTAEGAVIPAETTQEPANAAAGGVPSPEPTAEAKPKRKRRTKAEIAADEAAAKSPLDNLKPETEPTNESSTDESSTDESSTDEPAAISPEIVALAATIDGADKLAHMNEGREFISAHGFPKYNETFALADVPANIAAHTPEQAALHRAAMQWVVAQGGAK